MNILLPIETINRELDFKITLAALLKAEGRSIFIGQHDFMNSLVDHFEKLNFNIHSINLDKELL